jgi:hypothetical protein
MNILTNAGLVSSAATMWQGKVDDISALTLTVRGIVGSTITIETAPDNSTWTAIPYFQNVTSNPAVLVSGSTITTLGKFWVPTFNAVYIRIRVSTYVGPGNVDWDVEPSVQINRVLLQALVTAEVANGAAQITATPIQAWFTRFATVAASTGAILPQSLGYGQELVVRNAGANSLTVYPPVGGKINGGSVNAGVAIAAAGATRFISDGANGFWSF